MELVYCFKCGERILAEELRKGRALRKWNKFVCFSCAKEMGLHAGKEAESPKPPTSRIRQKPAPIRGATTRRVRPVVAEEPPPTPASSAKKRNLILGGVAGLVGVIVVILLVTRGGDAPETPGAGLPTAVTPEVEPAKKATENEAPADAAVLAKVRAFVEAHPDNLTGQVEAYEQALKDAVGEKTRSVLHREQEGLVRKHRARIDGEIAVLDRQIRDALKAETFREAIATVDGAGTLLTSPEWSTLVAKRKRELSSAIDGRYATLARAAVAAKQEGAESDVTSLRERVVGWGMEDLVARLDKELAAVKAKAGEPAVAKEPAKPAEPVETPEQKEARLYQAKWVEAMAIARDRDPTGAVRALEGILPELKTRQSQVRAIADVERFRRLAAFYREVRGSIGALKPKRKVSLAWPDAEGKRQVVEGVVEAATPRWVKLEVEKKDEEGKPVEASMFVDVPMLEAESLLQFHEGGAPEVRALFRAIEGVDPGGEVPEEVRAWRSREPEEDYEAAARAAEAYGLFYSAWPKERELEAKVRRGGTLAVYRKLSTDYADTPIVRKFRDVILERSAPAEEFLFLGDDLEGGGTFGEQGVDEIGTAWRVREDSVPSVDALGNNVSFSFETVPDAKVKAWAYVTACCLEKLAFFVQATGLKVRDPRSRTEVPCEPGANLAMEAKVRLSGYSRSHAGHTRPGVRPREPKWGWVELPMPDEPVQGTTEYRIISFHKDFTVAWVTVSSQRRTPPRDREILPIVAAATTGLGASAVRVPREGLVAYWPFDEGKGTAAKDASGNGNDGTLVNGAGWTKGVVGGALMLGGDGGYVTIPNEERFDFTEAMTVAFWFRVDSFTTEWQAMVVKGEQSWRIHRGARSSNLSFSTTGPGNRDQRSGSTIDDGRWHHAAAVYDGSTKWIYLDGRVDSSVPTSGSLNNHHQPVWIGGNNDINGHRTFHGAFDEVAIYDRALTAEEIATLASAGRR